jgi:hypothetical protein
MGCVYLILEISDNSERHKIGTSKRDVLKRLKELQTGNSNIVRVLNYYESPNYKKIERLLHKKFGNQKTETDNEWFTLTNEQVIGFNSICKEADKTISFLIKNNPFYC